MVQVQEKLPWFLKAVPSAECAKGGVGGYNNALQMDAADPTGIAGLSKGQVTASSFRTYYVPLNTQQNFIDAYQVSWWHLHCKRETRLAECSTKLWPASHHTMSVLESS